MNKETYILIKEQVNMETGEVFIFMKKRTFYSLLFMLILSCFGVSILFGLIWKII